MRAHVIREQLGYLHERLASRRVPMAIDVFGLTATDTTDMGIGQTVGAVRRSGGRRAADDVSVPLRAGHVRPRESQRASVRGRSTMRCADAKRRSAGIAARGQDRARGIRTSRSVRRTTARHVRAQMQAGYDNGIRSWMLWNPGSRYTEAALRSAIGRESEERTRKRAVDTISPTSLVPTSDTARLR